MRIRELRDGKPIGDRRLATFRDEDAIPALAMGKDG